MGKNKYAMHGAKIRIKLGLPKEGDCEKSHQVPLMGDYHYYYHFPAFFLSFFPKKKIWKKVCPLQSH